MAYRSEDALPAAIGAARACSFVDRVIVVDNASPDASADVARTLGCTVVRAGENRGFGAGQNRGIREAEAPFVLLLNPDAIVACDGVERGLEVLTAEPDVALVQGVIRRADDGAEERWQGRAPGLRDLVARLLHLRELLGEDRLRKLAGVAGAAHYKTRSIQERRDVEFIAAVAPLVRRSALLAVGGFDERIFLYAEDVDLCLRLRRDGWRVVALPVEWARHVGAASSEGVRSSVATAWWRGHRSVIRSHWPHGPRRWVGEGITAVGEWSARREADS